MIKITAKMKDGTYKTKFIEDFELLTIKEKMLKLRKEEKIEYWFLEKEVKK